MKISNPLINSGSTLLDILSPGEKPVRWNAVRASKMAKHCRNSVPAYKMSSSVEFPTKVISKQQRGS